MNEDTYMAMKKDELIDVCKQLGLSSEGRKNEMIQRILRHEKQSSGSGENRDEGAVGGVDPHQREKQPSGSRENRDEGAVGGDDHRDGDDTEDDDDESTSEESDSDPEECVIATKPRKKHHKKSTKANFTFRDIEDALETFSGDPTEDIEEWLQEFETMAITFKWNDLHRFVYARKLMKNTARQFVSCTTGLTNWKALKRALKEEFKRKMNSAEVHVKLQQRKKKKDETFDQYIYAMKLIAKRSLIEEEALCDHIVEGIPDDPVSKAQLYGCKTVSELKTYIEKYEKMKTQTKSKDSLLKVENTKDAPKKSSGGSKNSTEEKKSRCFNCGNQGHVSRECPDSAKGPKCFSCKEFGHRSNDCKKKKSEKEARVDMMYDGDSNLIEVLVDGISVRAFFDSGSTYNLITQKTWKRCGNIKISSTDITLRGLNSVTAKPIGWCELNAEINGEKYDKFRFLVVPDDAIGYEMILGRESLEFFEVICTTKKPILRRITGRQKVEDEMETSNDDFQGEILNISYVDENELDVALEHRDVVKKLVENYTPNSKVESRIQTKIILTDEEPIYQRARRLAPLEKEVVEKQVKEWLDDGIIRPSSSDFASPLTLAPKKDGSYRVCVDFRRLNKKIVKDRFPMPLIEDQIDQLKDATIYTTLDLKNSFFHVSVAEESRKYTAFSTPRGQYEFNKTPFGLCLSPASFNRFVSDVFRGLIQEGIMLMYVDDLIIPARNIEENLQRLKRVLDVAAEKGLIFNWKKSQFLKKEVEYLGFIVSGQTIKPSERKTIAVKNFPEPKTVKEVQRFLGLTGYFRKFIAGYALMARPLTDLLKKDVKFQFGEEQRKGFELLKEAMAKDPVLMIYDPNAETELHTDASVDGYGAVLMQKCEKTQKFHPVYYMSKKTKPEERNYSPYHLEALAIVNAVKKLRVYLLGIRFKIVTDCAAFHHTLKGKELSPRVSRWALMLEEYDYQVEHREGSKMKHADALSRAPVMIINDPLLDLIKATQRKDERLKAIIELAKEDGYEDYHVRNGVLMKFIDGRDVIVVPIDLQSDVIRRCHENGHFGIKKVEELVKRDYYIPNLTEKIRERISCCVPCILSERKRGKVEGLLNPIPKGDVPLDTYHIDHVGPLNTTDKLYKYLFVVVDAFSKYVWLYPTKTTNAKEVLDKLKLQQTHFGNPRRIISDKGAAFTSQDFKEYCEEENIQHVLTTTGVPRSNGQVERVHQIVLAMLAKLSEEQPSKWYKHVSSIQRFINGSYQRSVATTPFQLMFGITMRHKDDPKLCELLEETLVVQFDEARAEQRAQARENILKVQEEQRRNYNLRSKEARKYKIGDVVAIKRTQFAPGMKYRREYLGPYQVTNVKTNDRYDVLKIGTSEGPKKTSTSADYMKPFVFK